jgi:hypothetical protein
VPWLWILHSFVGWTHLTVVGIASARVPILAVRGEVATDVLGESGQAMAEARVDSV